MLTTRVTDFFGIRLPIVAGGLQWLATADYAAAASRAGIMGFMTAASFPDLPSLRAGIRRCRDLCDGGPFGVNVSMLPKLVEGDRAEAIFDLIAEEEVRFVETSGRNPEPYLQHLHTAGIKVVHKVSTVKHARKAQAVGVDMVEIIGAEAGGHPGMALVGTIIQAALAARDITIPLVVGGGIGTGAQLVAALALGADGVLMGTRFLVAEEVWAHPAYKRRLVEAGETDTMLVMQSLRNTVRALRNETTEHIQAVEAETPGDLAALMPLISGTLGRQAYETGEIRTGMLSLGQSVAFADRIEPLARIVERIADEAADAVQRVNRLGGCEPHRVS